MNKSSKTPGGGRLFSLIISCIILIGSVLTVYFAVIKPASDTEAFSSSNTSSYKQVGELLIDPQSATATKPFNKTNMATLVNMIYGSSGDMATQITSLTSTASSTPITAKTLRAKTYNKTNGQSIVVRLGGLDWIVTYVSTDTSGNLVATLWLSNNHQDAWSGRNDGVGKYYGFVSGGLYSDWSADWYNTTVGTYPSSMYGTSYIRVETLNNPSNRTYATSNSALTNGTTQSTTHPFALYTVASKGLTNYITTPDQMKWMVNRQNPGYVGSIYWSSNESLTSGNAYSYSASGWNGTDSNYESKKGYANWGKDYLWLPSTVETGGDDTNDGMWETNTAERTTYNGSTTSLRVSSAIGSSSNSNGSSTTAYTYSWSRSAVAGLAGFSNCLSPSGSNYANNYVYSSQAVRPALLLNLGSAVSRSATLSNITFDKQGGSGGTTSVSVAEGSTLPNITAPTRTGHTFGGYYTSTNGGDTKIYNTDGTPAISASTFTTDTTLYAYWLDIRLGEHISSCFDYTITNPYSGRYTDSTYLWIIKDNCIKSTNQGIQNSRSGFSLSFTASSSGTLEITYKVSSESASYDYLEIKSSNTAVSWTNVGGTSMTAFETETLPIVQGENLWEFYYRKDGSQDKGDDCAYISSIKIKAVVSVTFDTQSATSAGTASVKATYGEALSAITPPTRTNHEFMGYYTATNGGGTKVYNADGTPAISASTFTANTTLYAYWIAYKKIILATNISGAAGVLTGGGTYVQGSQVTLSAYANKGYNFCYWLKGGAEFSGNDTNVITVTTDSDVTYTAVFEEAGVKINTVAVVATEGGYAYVVGRNVESLNDDDELIIAADLCDGYAFVGWYDYEDMTTCLYTDMSVKVKKKDAVGHIFVAVFAPISNSNVNQDTDN